MVYTLWINLVPPTFRKTIESVEASGILAGDHRAPCFSHTRSLTHWPTLTLTRSHPPYSLEFSLGRPHLLRWAHPFLGVDVFLLSLLLKLLGGWSGRLHRFLRTLLEFHLPYRERAGESQRERERAREREGGGQREMTPW